jgi:non-ribosomal peptide synthetase component E (peptide arylation enzyme)
MLLWDHLKSHAATRGEKLALVCGDTTLTYAQFAVAAENLAHAWLRQGLHPGRHRREESSRARG